MELLLKGFLEEMVQFSKCLSDFTNWKNHIEEKMSSSDKEYQMSLHGAGDFSVEDTLRGPDIDDFKSTAFRGQGDHIASLIDGCDDVENSHIFTLDEICNVLQSDEYF